MRKSLEKKALEALTFVEHIEDHLREMDKQDQAKSRGYTLKVPREVMCKICDRTMKEIIEEST